MLNSKLNIVSNTYFSNCDLINKYNFKSLHKIPKLKKVVIDFTLSDFLISSDFSSSKEQTDSSVQIKSFIIFYILTESLSYINFNKSLSSIKKLKLSENNYSLKVSITNPKELNSFLFSFFVESWSKLLIDDFVLFKKDNTLVNKVNQCSNQFVFSTYIPSSSFVELESFLNKTNIGVNSKNLNIKINFVFENTPVKSKNLQNLIKNLPYFWISG